MTFDSILRGWVLFELYFNRNFITWDQNKNWRAGYLFFNLLQVAYGDEL